ncbi:hypothetical protein LCGC14_1864640, partial [marine sediment metagenome]
MRRRALCILIAVAGTWVPCAQPAPGQIFLNPRRKPAVVVLGSEDAGGSAKPIPLINADEEMAVYLK